MSFFFWIIDVEDVKYLVVGVMFLFFVLWLWCWEMQEHEIEYVEGYKELEEEDDIEDLDGLAIDNSHSDDENGKKHYIINFSVFLVPTRFFF